MITLSEAKDLEEQARKLSICNRVPELEDPPKYLWSETHYDGLATGVCLYQGTEHAFMRTTIDESIYLIVKLTPEQLEEKRKRHQLFINLVGSHTTYDENGNTGKQLSDDKIQSKLYYKKLHAMKRISLEENEVVAWYRW